MNFPGIVLNPASNFSGFALGLRDSGSRVQGLGLGFKLTLNPHSKPHNVGAFKNVSRVSDPIMLHL